VLDLDDHGTARADNHNVDFVCLTTGICMREVGQDEGSVLPFGTTKLLVDSVEGLEFARTGKRTTWYMYNAQANPSDFKTTYLQTDLVQQHGIGQKGGVLPVVLKFFADGGAE
jgi:hypothetical protein